MHGGQWSRWAYFLLFGGGGRSQWRMGTDVMCNCNRQPTTVFLDSRVFDLNCYAYICICVCVCLCICSCIQEISKPRAQILKLPIGAHFHLYLNRCVCVCNCVCICSCIQETSKPRWDSPVTIPCAITFPLVYQIHQISSESPEWNTFYQTIQLFLAIGDAIFQLSSTHR